MDPVANFKELTVYGRSGIHSELGFLGLQMAEAHPDQTGQREEPTGSRNLKGDQGITLPEGWGLPGNQEQLDPPPGPSPCLHL